MNKDENQKVSQGLVAAFEHDCRLFGLLFLPKPGALEGRQGGDCGERRLRPTHADFLHVDLDILPHPTSRHATQRVAMVAAGFSGWHSGFALSPASNGGRRNQPSLSAKHDALFPLPNRDCCGCGDCQTGWKRWLADGLHHADQPHGGSPHLDQARGVLVGRMVRNAGHRHGFVLVARRQGDVQFT